MPETHNKRVSFATNVTERVRLWRATLDHPRRDGKQWYWYAEWINAAGHAFRKEMGFREYQPIGHMPEFTEFLGTYGRIPF